MDPIIVCRDSTFFSNDRYVVFKVENILFRIKSKHLTSQSQAFSDLLSIPSSSSIPMDGETEENPIELAQEAASTFRKALEWLRYERKGRKEKLGASVSEWKSLFIFAKKWQIDKMQDEASVSLKNINWEDPMDKIQYAIENELPLSWASNAFSALCQRKTPTFQEARAMPKDLFILVELLKDRRKSIRSECCICRRSFVGCVCPWSWELNYINNWIEEITKDVKDLVLVHPR
ncbi:hypothetical protein DL96DRAFT_1639968 [Flagelloscypha sp. PMI_526]|nr:hypothetical protein DL96DRAFT_1639968 [Flagelloscypha sp. PMI_526]